jgi:cholest-4-en-3-one 26-monooxygenase
MPPFNFLDLDLFTRDTPHAELTHLRRTAPVYWHPMPTPREPQGGFWLLTRYDDVTQTAKNTKVFASSSGTTLTDAPPPTAPVEWLMVRYGFAHLDPPEHPMHRQIIAPSFTPRAIAAFETKIRALADEILDGACAAREIDFAARVAVRFPVAVVFGAVMGLPQEDFARAARWGDVVIAPSDPEFASERGAVTGAVEDLYQYALETMAARRKNPTDDVLSALAHARTPEGKPISEAMFTRFFWSLAIGAFDTTASTIAAGMLALVRFPEQHERLRADASLLPSAVEEMLRWESPVVYFRRTATEDTEIRGRAIGRGQRVAMCFASANRDEEVFPAADTFDVGRHPNEHVAFGYGPHFCLGARLARVQTRILFERIMERGISVELRGEVRRARSNFINRIKRMPVVLRERG